MQGAAGVEKGFDNLRPSGYNNQVFTRGVSTSVVRRLPKPNRRVRLPYPAPVRRKRHIACDDFFAKIIARSFCCSSLPHKTLLAQIFAGTPAAPVGGDEQALYCLRRFFCKNHRALILLLLISPQNFACANFCGDPGRPGGRQYIRFVSLAAFSQTKSPGRTFFRGFFSFF